MANYEAVQKELLNRVKSRSSEKLVDVLCDALNLSIDASYRRIRGEKLLDLSEIIVLCNKFNISIDDMLSVAGNVKTVQFVFPFKDLDFDFTDYLKSVLQNLTMVKENNGHIYYSAKDLPLFHCFQSELLTKFKIYYWLKTMLSRRDLIGVKFDDFKLEDEQMELGKAIAQVYSDTNSTEIWNYETIHGLSSQVSYYLTVGFITKEQAKDLLNEIKSLLQHLFTAAELEQKFIVGKRKLGEEANFKLLFNEVLATDNSIYADMGELKAAFMPHIILNYITTFDEEYCDYIQNVFDSVVKKSTLISGVNEKDRSLFFNYAFDRIDKTIQNL